VFQIGIQPVTGSKTTPDSSPVTVLQGMANLFKSAKFAEISLDGTRSGSVLIGGLELDPEGVGSAVGAFTKINLFQNSHFHQTVLFRCRRTVPKTLLKKLILEG